MDDSPVADGDAPPAVHPTEITAGDLHLRPWQTEDVPAVAALVPDPAIARWNPFPAGPDDLRRAEAFVAARGDWGAGGHASFAVLDSTTAAVLGSVSLFGLRAEPGADGAADRLRGEIGFWTAPEARGRGVATQAVGAVTRWASAAVGLEEIDLIHAVGNAAACRVAQRCGYPHVATTPQSWTYGDGERHDEHVHVWRTPHGR